MIDAANAVRVRAILLSREVRAILKGPPERFAKALAGRWFLSVLLKWLFLGPDGRPHRAGEIVLAELRDRNGLARGTIFDPDPQVMAYREGRRAAALEIFNLLNLDEAEVQQLMRLDDDYD